MGVYNPSNPHILGQEWVPIREPDLTFPRFNSPVEYGHRFTLEADAFINRGFFYIKEYPPDFVLWQPWTMSVYPLGTETDTGPIQRLVVPVSTNSTLTNSAGTGAQLINCGTVAQALQDPSSDSFLSLTPHNNNAFFVKVFFNTTSYANVFAGKRILGLNILWASSYSANTTDPFTLNNIVSELKTPSSGSTQGYPVLDLNVFQPAQVNRTALGDTNRLWGVTVEDNTVDLMPWDSGSLARFNDTGANGIWLNIRNNVQFNTIDGEAWGLTYVALEVIFCEEQRVAVGTKLIGPTGSGHTTSPPGAPGVNFHDFWFQFNANQVFLRKVTSSFGDPNPKLSQGEFTVTIMRANVGDAKIQSQFPVPSPVVQAARQLYALPNHKGIKITHPTPVDTTILNKTFTVSETDILPQLSLFISGGVGGNNGSVLPQMHVYGQQTAAQVNSAQTPTSQLIDTLTTGGTAQYKYIRFYARKFAGTTTPLVFSSASPSLSGGANTLVWTPWEQDQLPEIVDGWKEVTLTYPTPVTLGGGLLPTIRFTNAGAPGSEWQVLGASSLALSGRPDFTGQLYPLPWRSNAANYGGQVEFESWNYQGMLEPAVGTVTSDVSSDMSFLFAQQFTAPTGMTLSQLSQPMSGIGTLCGVSPMGIPTGITYNRITWGPTNGIAADDFSRTVAAGSLGGNWIFIDGTAANWSVNGSAAVNATTASSTRQVWFYAGPSYTDSDAYMKFTPIIDQTTVMASGKAYSYFIFARATDLNNYYAGRVQWNSGAPTLSVSRRVAGSNFNLGGRADVPIDIPLISGRQYTMRFNVQGYLFRMKAWFTSEPEPDDWMLSWTDPVQQFASGAAGMGTSITATIPSNATQIDDFYVAPFAIMGSSYELQRMDALDTTWRTILNTKNLSTLGFNDYEARVGILTSYQIRVNDQYNFNGAFSNTVSGTIAAPGISGGSITASGQHIMTFTSNEHQDGSRNLAYSNAWQSAVSEPFSFPEAGQVQLQQMFGKDFFTAFHSLERGGVRFQRNVLVQAAAIAPPTLADFTSMRDMAWDSLSYVCVRDEGGNRWFMVVMVPSGNVTNNRQLYIAALDMAEVTATPSQVST